MILSHKHKFVFIKGKKVAGTSAEIALSQVCGPNDIITPIMPPDERYRLGTAGEPRNYASRRYPWPLNRYIEHRFVDSIRDGKRELGDIRFPNSRFANHMPLSDVLRMVPAARQYEVLCVERSPYAKVLSLANWLEHATVYKKRGKLPDETRSLGDAVDRIIADGSINAVRNIALYRDLDGRVTVKPWTSGTLAADMADFFRSRSLDPVPLVSAKRGANSDTIDPRQVLRPDQIAAINKIFAEEFDLFGWRMIEGQPTRASR